jgi:hypothetical protein
MNDLSNIDGSREQLKEGAETSRKSGDKSLDDLEQYLRGLFGTGIDGLSGDEYSRGQLGRIMFLAECAAGSRYCEASYARELINRNSKVEAQEKQIRILQATLKEMKA